MKIAQLAPHYNSVMPNSNKAIYSHVAWLCNGLVDLGNDVSLFASGDSQTNAKLNSVYPIAVNKGDINDNQKKLYLDLLISECYRRAEEFDIIHSHFTLVSSFYSRINGNLTVQSIHSPVEEHTKCLLRKFKDNNYISFSLAQRKIMPELNWVANIYHGIDTEIFSFNPDPNPYLLYLGRVTEQKGVHLAIEAARATGMQLIIAGRSYPNEGYWHEQIEKHIDGKNIRYVGEASFEQKIEYLRNATALMFPTQYEEVFGYSMIEAMSCGTPVIGWKNGSVPEVIQDKKTGYLVNNVKDMVKAIKNINKLKREAVRERAERLFSVQKMVSGYNKVYEKIIAENESKKK